MPIYISKKALTKNPLFNNPVAPDKSGYPPLKSGILQVHYLKILINSNNSILNLSAYMDQDSPDIRHAVVRLKVALNVIHLYTKQNEYEIPSGLFDTINTEAWRFDQNMADAVSEFQDFAGIDKTGVVNAETLSKIDYYQDYDVIIDYEKNKIIGKTGEAHVNIFSNDKDKDGKFKYKLEIGSKVYAFQSSEPLQVTPTIDNLEENETVNAVLDSNIIGNMEFEGNPLSETEVDFLYTKGYAVFENSEKLSLSQDKNVPLTKPNVKKKVSDTPPKRFHDDEAKLYKIQAGDNVSKIVSDAYYGTGAVDVLSVIKPEGSDEYPVIFTLPDRIERPIDQRDKDPRFQFYTNLLYYYNTVEGDDGGEPDEFGIKKAQGYERYQEEDLNTYNIYDNAFDSSNEDTVYPNYYRFLRAQEAKNPATKLKFDTKGDCTSFDTEEGKSIYIPSRKFADTLYYHINFRHAEMLTKSLQYVTESVLDNIISQMEKVGDWVDDIVNWVIDTGEEAVNEVAELYRETLSFFKAIYKFVKDVLSTGILRGWGGHAGASLGVTWLVVAADVKPKLTMWRKFTNLDEFTIALRGELDVFGGVDVGVSLGLAAFFGGGKKRKGPSLGVGGGFGIKSGYRVNIILDCELTIRQEENALLSVIFIAFGFVLDKALPVPGSSKVMTKMLEALTNLNLDPEHYITWARCSITKETKVWGAAQIGFIENEEDNEEKSTFITNSSAIPETSDKGFWKLGTILNKLPGAGISLEGRFAKGLEFEYEAKYDDNPCIPEISGRVPSSAQVKLLVFAEASLVNRSIGNLLQRVLMGVTVQPLLSFLSFEQGVGIGVNFDFTRVSAAKEVELEDVDFSNANRLNTNIKNLGSKLFFDGEKVTLESQLFFMRYSGDPEGLFVTGSENLIKLDTYKVYEVLSSTDAAAEFFSMKNVDNFFKIIHSIEFQYKQSLRGIDQTLRRKLASDVYNKINFGRQSQILVRAKKIGAQIFIGAYVKVEFNIQDMVNIFKYFVKRWYLMFKYLSTPYWTEINVKLSKLEEAFSKENQNALPMKKTTLKEYTENLYEYLNKQITEHMTIGNKNYNVPDKFTEVDEDFSFTKAARKMFEVTNLLAQYIVNPKMAIADLNDEAEDLIDKFEDLKLGQFVKALAYVADIIDAKASVEARFGAGGTLQGNIALGGKFRGSLFGEGALILNYLLMEDTKFPELDDDDPYYIPIKKIKEILNVNIDNTNEGSIRDSLTQLPV